MTTDTPYYTETIPGIEVQFRMVSIPAGTFLMGSPKDDPDADNDEQPEHSVALSAFQIGEFPVTQALWTAVMKKKPAHFLGEQRPVEQVSWFDAAVFCNALSVLTDRKPVYSTPNGPDFGWAENQWTLPNEGAVQRDWDANGYCLPTEAQWEYAARAPDAALPKGYRYAGSDLLDQVAWYEENSDRQTHPVGLLLPNAWGLYDMSGNVYEWCEDWWGAYPKKNGQGPKEGINRVLRGGFWIIDPQLCRSAYRDFNRPDYRYGNIGFRLALQSVG